MRTRHTNTARRTIRSLTLPATIATLLTVATPPAAAHTTLDASTPANGAVLTALPHTITLTFNEPLPRTPTQLTVTAPDGTALADGAPKVTARELTQKLKPSTTAGRYTVSYQIISTDGHTTTGTSTFTVRGAQPPTPKTTKPTTPSRAAVASGERAATSLKAIGIGFALGLVALITAMTMTVRRQKQGKNNTSQ
ncbi:copper resistance protein CopC [Streptomyces sp. NPDC094032]|uniref:copper resistance CopC family protein n=1 Tax=Streptomyces sp. NPDC094032 TaxID=3155308 RepID=UPI003330EC46